MSEFDGNSTGPAAKQVQSQLRGPVEAVTGDPRPEAGTEQSRWNAAGGRTPAAPPPRARSQLVATGDDALTATDQANRPTPAQPAGPGLVGV